MSDISKNIKRLRQQKGLTQDELAEKLQVAPQTVTDWEAGTDRPDLPALESLAQIFEVDGEELVYGPPTQSTKKKKILTAVLFLAAGTAFYLTSLFLTGLSAGVAGQTYSFPWYDRLTLWLLAPLSYLLLGAGVAAVSFLLEDLRPRKKWLRAVLIAAALLLAALYWGAVLCMFNPGGTGLVSQLFRLYSLNGFWLLMAVLNHKQFLMFSGFFLFCALYPKRG